MGVYIPKMEMPMNCWEDDCPCLDKQYGICRANADKGYVYSNRPSWCPLVEVKPHGRLIEDTVLDDMCIWDTSREYDKGWNSAVRMARERLADAPTIIEGEGKE